MTTPISAWRGGLVVQPIAPQVKARRSSIETIGPYPDRHFFMRIKSSQVARR